MTKHKTLKQHVRDRQQKTGERYTTALAHLQAHRSVVPKKDEPFDATKVARALGLSCHASLSAELAAGADRERRARGVLDALRALLLALDGDAGATKMAEVVLHGNSGARGVPHALAEAAAARAFLRSIRDGKRGVSANGRLAAFDVDGVTVVATLLWNPLAATRPALVYLARFDHDALEGPWTEALTLAGLGGLGGER